MIEIILADGNKKQFDNALSGYAIAQSISEGFAGNAVAMRVNGELRDLNSVVDRAAQIDFITVKEPEALEIMRHSAAHVMAQAIKRLNKNAKPAIGPAIEDGFYYDIDMTPISEADFTKIEDEMQKIIKEKQPIVREEISKAEALKLFADDKYKVEMIEALADGQISVYREGEFVDLCRGPHVPHTGFVKAFKLLKTSGAYWRADQSREQLQRVYGTAFFDKKDLKAYLTFLEEAAKRNHRKLGTQLDLFSFHEEAPGMPFFHAKGMAVWNALLDYWRIEHARAGYVETKTPIILNRQLWERSGHWENYRENMYTTVIDEEDYAIKPMNCPGGMLLYKTHPHSYRELPIRAGEIGLVHRHELSGVLNGLFRVRAFHQDDAHIFMRPDQIQDEILGVLKLVERVYGTFGLDFMLELSTRPAKAIGNDELWETATKGLEDALKASGRAYKINPGDGAFYGPKIDIHIKDALNRTWQCGTIQLDMAMPERFDLTYVDADGERKRPVMIHRVIYGSIERFFGILLEHFAGKFPLWLAPVQVVVLPINDELESHAREAAAKLQAEGLRVSVDARTESLNKKVREAQLNYIPLIITIGNKEVETGTLSVRTLNGSVKFGLSFNAFTNTVCNHVKTRKLDLDIFA